MPLTGQADCNDGRAGRRSSRPGDRHRAPLLLVAAFGFGAAAADFEVSAGYLSTNAEKLATGHGWSLVWEAGEDRLIEHPFTIANDSLRRGLEGLLGAYQGQFVADLYRSNEVVVVSTPLPQLEVVLPGAAQAAEDLALDNTQRQPFRQEADAPTPDAGALPVRRGTAALPSPSVIDVGSGAVP